MRALLSLCAFLLIGCDTARSMHRLAKAMGEEFADTKVGVSLTDHILLTVTARDSVLAVASCETQVGFAMRVGQFLRTHYPGLESLQVVNVAFTRDPEQGVVPVNKAHLPIRWQPRAVRAGLQAQDSVKAVESCRAFEELNA